MKKNCITIIFCLLVGIAHNFSFAQNVWIKSPANPVLNVGVSGSADECGVMNPCVIKDGDTYKMWYAANDCSFTQICYATSLDGVHWSKYVGNPVLSVGAAGSWEDDEVTEPTVLKEGNLYKMWYTGLHNDIGNIGYATSPDGINWTKHAGNPVLLGGSAGNWDAEGVGEACVINDAGVYQMWFASNVEVSEIDEAIGYATSSDGINWTKHANNPVLVSGSAGTWDGGDVDNPSVIKQGLVYHLWYEGEDYYNDTCRIGYASSLDGLQWNKSLDNPVLDIGTSGTWDEIEVTNPAVVAFNNTFKMWYSSSDQIGLAKMSISFDSSDLADMADHWLGLLPGHGMDLYPDGKINHVDFALLASNWLNGEVADHVFEIKIETGIDYWNPDLSNDTSFEFNLEMVTDNQVQRIEFVSPPPASETYELTNNSPTEWHYEANFATVEGLDEFAYGQYLIKVYLYDGSFYETTVSFSTAGTDDPIPQPTQVPTFTSITNGEVSPSPVTLEWQACIDPDVYVTDISVDNIDTWEELLNETLPGSAIELSEPIDLEHGNYEIDLGFRVEYNIENQDGIPVELMKWCESDYEITIDDPVAGAMWTWVSGSNVINQYGVYGTKSVAASSNVPGARGGSVSWIDQSGNLWLFGGGGYAASGSGYLNDLWKFDGTNWTWFSGSNASSQSGVYGTKGVAASTNVPGGRSGSVSWIDNGGNLWLWGGVGYAATGSGGLNDLWKFDGTNWTWFSGSNTGNQFGLYGTKGVAASGNVPGARYSSISWIDSNGNFWLFGGRGYAAGTYGRLNDLWKFDGANWMWVSGSNTGDQYGTYGTKGVAASSNVPGAREGSVSWVDNSGNFWLFGGYGYAASGSGYLNDLWKFDGTNWTWFSGSNATNQYGVYGTKGIAAPDNVPEAGSGSISWVDSNGNLWLFGGSKSSCWNTLWKFDGTNWTWVSGSDIHDQYGTYGTKGVASPDNVPGSRYGSISWIDSNGKFWLFGGSTGSGFLNDLWKFDLP